MGNKLQTKQAPETVQRLLYSLDEAAAALGMGRTRVYKEIQLGRLRAVKSGKRTLIPADALRDMIDNLPSAAAKPRKAA